MQKQTPMVMYDSPEAAQLVTVTGWKARTGQFFVDNEHMARYCGCTHIRCEGCGGVRERGGWCRPCHAAKRQATFASYERKAWDGIEVICLFDDDVYFFDSDSLSDYCAEHQVKAMDLQLVFCEPNYASTIDPQDHFADERAEDGDIPDDLAAAFEVLNQCIEAHKTPLSWSPGNVAVDPASVAAWLGEVA